MCLKKEIGKSKGTKRYLGKIFKQKDHICSCAPIIRCSSVCLWQEGCRNVCDERGNINTET